MKTDRLNLTMAGLLALVSSAICSSVMALWLVFRGFNPTAINALDEV